MKHNAYKAAESLAHAAHKHTDMESTIASGNPDEGTFSFVVKGRAYTVIVRPLRYHEPPELTMGAAAAAQFLAEMDAERQGRIQARLEADLGALREAAWTVVNAWWNGPETDAEVEPLRAVLISADSESREETP